MVYDHIHIVFIFYAGVYHPKKLTIDARKQRDIHLLSKFCTHLDEEELQYWYPPCDTEILEEDEEREEAELPNDLTNDLEKVCSQQELQQLQKLIQSLN